MRLLETSWTSEEWTSEEERNPSLREFVGDNIPRYAILSHTWGHDEVLFKDIENGTAHRRESFYKVKSAAAQAARDGFAYVWIDTCCIDKSSSAELQEAINSMFAWYQNAEVCYVYLVDVDKTMDSVGFAEEFQQSRWFTRGWTLQELIAPMHVRFYTRAWVPVGGVHYVESAYDGAIRYSFNRIEPESLVSHIQKATSIPDEYLTSKSIDLLRETSVASRMSWASKRQTTRIEDKAYCLMGIFGVNMTMLYGEGSKAFLRLQEEIMKTNDDFSLFAWSDTMAGHLRPSPSKHGLLADDPLAFNWVSVSESNLATDKWPWRDSHTAPHSMTNKGLRIQVELLRLPNAIDFAILKYLWQGSLLRCTGLFLQPLLGEDGKFMRVFCDLIEDSIVVDPLPLQEIFVRQNVLRERLFIHGEWATCRFWTLHGNAETRKHFDIVKCIFTSPHHNAHDMEQINLIAIDRQEAAWSALQEAIIPVSPPLSNLALALVIRHRETQEHLVATFGSFTKLTLGSAVDEAHRVANDPLRLTIEEAQSAYRRARPIGLTHLIPLQRPTYVVRLVESKVDSKMARKHSQAGDSSTQVLPDRDQTFDDAAASLKTFTLGVRALWRSRDLETSVT